MGVCNLVVLRRCHGSALHLLPRHRQLRAVPADRVDRLPGDDHHRRAGVDPRLDSWRHLRHDVADPDALVPRGLRLAALLGTGFAERDPQFAADPVWRPDHLLPGGGAGRVEPAVAQYPKLFPGLAIFVLTGPGTTREEEPW